MAAAIITSTPTHCIGAAAVKTHADTLSLSQTTDQLHVVGVPGRNDTYLVFTTEDT